MTVTLEEKIAETKALIGPDEEATTELVTVYLNIAKDKINDRLYPMMSHQPADVPSRYDHLQCELASRGFLRRGGEGETSHEENGVNRTYADTTDMDLLRRIVPFAAVVG